MISASEAPASQYTGKECSVTANYVLVGFPPQIYKYNVSITPRVSKSVNRGVMNQFFHRRTAYDGKNNLYTAAPLPFNEKKFVICYICNDGLSRKGIKFDVVIKFSSEVECCTHQEFFGKKYMKSLNAVFRVGLLAKHTVVGRSFFSRTLEPHGYIGEGVEYWTGFSCTIRPTQIGLSLNIDVLAKTFFEPIQVTRFVSKYFNGRNLRRPIVGRLREECNFGCTNSDSLLTRMLLRLPKQLEMKKIEEVLKGVMVEVEYKGYTQHHEISGISALPTWLLKFDHKVMGKRISVADYFSKHYNIRLRLANLPSLLVGTKENPIYLPMEICKIVEGQLYVSKLSDRQLTEFKKVTWIHSDEKEQSIRKTLHTIDFNHDPLLNGEFGIKVNSELASFKARVLPPPKLTCCNYSGQEEIVDPKLGQWNMENKRMGKGGSVDFWTCLNFSRTLNSDMAYQFCQRLSIVCLEKGMNFNDFPLLPIRSAVYSEIGEALSYVHKTSERKLKKLGENLTLQLLIIILPECGGYGEIKQICETQLGLVSQCCRAKNALECKEQFLENLALKINVKVGGWNTMLSNPCTENDPVLIPEPTIIFGASLNRPRPAADSSSPLIAAVVALMDWPKGTKYEALVSQQTRQDGITSSKKTRQDGITSSKKTRQDGIIQNLFEKANESEGKPPGGMIRELLIKFRDSTGKTPARIIMYRNGVSEGQCEEVLQYELDGIRKACSSIEVGYMPKVTFVLVQKSHRTRFFAVDQPGSDGNISPGTIVDANICKYPGSFYLCSHAATQGTSRPTLYKVLWSDNQFSADDLPMLTNRLCYTSARSTQSISIVSPAYYAYLAARRARNYIEATSAVQPVIQIKDNVQDTSAVQPVQDTSAVQPVIQIKDNVLNVMFYC